MRLAYDAQVSKANFELELKKNQNLQARNLQLGTLEHKSSHKNVFLFLLVFNAYRPTQGILPEIDEFIKLSKVMSFVVVTLILFQFFIEVMPGSRMVVFYFWIFSIVLLAFFRFFIFRMEVYFFKTGRGARRSLILGTSTLSQDIAERMILYPTMGYYYVGHLDDAQPALVHFHLKDHFQLLGTVDQFEAICKSEVIDSIFLVKRDIGRAQYRQLTQFALQNNIQLNVLSEPILDTPFIEVGAFDGISMISTMHLNRQWFQRVLKRAFDILISFLGLLTLSPVLLLIAAWIKLVSPKGPILFSQERVGQFSRPFQMLKFRSMIPNAENKKSKERQQHN